MPILYPSFVDCNKKLTEQTPPKNESRYKEFLSRKLIWSHLQNIIHFFRPDPIWSIERLRMSCRQRNRYISCYGIYYFLSGNFPISSILQNFLNIYDYSHIKYGMMFADGLVSSWCQKSCSQQYGIVQSAHISIVQVSDWVRVNEGTQQATNN